MHGISLNKTSPKAYAETLQLNKNFIIKKIPLLKMSALEISGETSREPLKDKNQKYIFTIALRR
jgi:hypothetical protein